MGDVIHLRKTETLDEVMAQAREENPDANGGLVIVFDGENEMTIYYNAAGMQIAYAAARLLHVAGRDNGT